MNKRKISRREFAKYSSGFIAAIVSTLYSPLAGNTATSDKWGGGNKWGGATKWGKPM